MSEKGRVFTFIVYPESAPSEYENMLYNEQFNVAISPLHEPDAEYTKPHKHVVVSFSGPKDIIELNEYLRNKYNSTYIFKVADTRKMIRYLIHQDNPEKQQNFKDKLIANYDVRQYLSNETYIQDIVNMIDANDLHNFSDLIKIYKDNFNVLEKISKNAYFFKTYLEMRK